MQIHEVCSQTGLTKKAVNWYMQQGLLKVNKDENGYRDFQGEDISRLKEIHVLRYLEIPAKVIKKILDSKDKTSILEEIRAQKQQEIQKLQGRMLLLDSLIQDYGAINQADYGRRTEDRSLIIDKLTLAFPGFWGEHLVRHFGPYLREPLQTQQQEEIYRQIIAWLDNVEIKVSFLLRFAERINKNQKKTQRNDPLLEIDRIVHASEEEQRQFVERIRKLRERGNRCHLRMLPIAAAVRHNNRVMRKRLTAAGYYDIFIPAIRKLSPQYNDYCAKLEELEKMVTAYSNVSTEN